MLNVDLAEVDLMPQSRNNSESDGNAVHSKERWLRRFLAAMNYQLIEVCAQGMPVKYKTPKFNFTSSRLGQLCNDPRANVFVEPVAAKNEIERYAARNQQGQDHSQRSKRNSFPGHNSPPLMLVPLGGDEVHISVKFVKLPSPHPGSFLKAPMPLPLGEGGRRLGERSVADRAALLGGLRLLATFYNHDDVFHLILLVRVGLVHARFH